MVCLFALAGSLAAQPTNEPIDWGKAQRLNARYQRGEPLTDADLIYLDRARTARTARTGEGAPPRPGVFTNRVLWTRSLTPLTAIGPGATYKGLNGGLYGEGLNTPPPALAGAARKALAEIRPLDAAGEPDGDGRVVLLSIGMSNTSQEFTAFKRLAEDEPTRWGALTIVDGAQGGRDAAQWDMGNLAALEVWSEVERRLALARVTPAQVQIAWIKQACSRPERLGAFPRHADVLKDHLIAIVQEAKRRFPNLRLAYLSSRTYGGYARSALNPEPYAYESAFAVRGVILEPLKGNPRLNSDPALGPVMAPVLLWGPYLWADGPRPRSDNGLVWEPADTGPDGVHPSQVGREKVASLLLEFFRTDPLARPWFTGLPAETAVVDTAPAPAPAP